MSGKLKAADFLAVPKSEDAEIARKKKRLAAFIKKFVDKSPFTLVSGGTAVLTLTDDDTKKLTDMLDRSRPVDADRTILTGMRFKSSDGRSLSLSHLEKTLEFGGKPAGEGAGVKAEKQAHQALVKQLGQIMEETGNDYVKVLIPGLNKNIPYKVTHAVWTDEALAGSSEKKTKPKSDLELWYEKTPVIFISYKDNYNRRLKKNGHRTVGYADPRGFQQFGGLSEGGSPEINRFPEVQNFIKYFKIMREEHGNKPGRWLKSPYGVKISSIPLKKMSVYGLGWQNGTGFNRQNCNIVLQGRVSLTESDEEEVYELIADHVLINSRNSNDGLESGPYEPILFVRWNPSRGGEANVRYAIMPRGGCGAFTELTKRDIDKKIADYEKQQSSKKVSDTQQKKLVEKLKKHLK